MPLLGVRAAARELEVAASTISRQIKSGLIPNRGTEDEPLVDLEEARAIRANMVDPTKRSIAAELLADDEEEEDLDGLDGGAPAAGENSEGARRAPVIDPEYHAARVEKAKIATKLAQLEYEKAAGLVINKADVEAAIMDATRELRDKLLHMGDKIAAEVAPVIDPVEVAKIIRDRLREALEQMTARLGQLGNG